MLDDNKYEEKAMKKQDIVNLIKYHVDKDEVSFTNTAANIARSFLDEGDEQVAKYIVGLLSGPISYSPQDLNSNYGFFTIVNKNADSLLLPNDLKKDLLGLVTACKSNLGINKIIFEGKPGTGKTQSALIISRALNRELLTVNANSIIDSKLGQSSKNLTDMFEFANHIAEKGDYVFLLDEIDSLVMDRINNRDLREMGRLTSAFIKELDRLNPNAILIATTNLFEELDRALRRRFDVCISFDRYSKDDLGDLAVSFAQDFIGDNFFDKSDAKLLKKMFVTSSVDMSPAEIKNLIRLSLAFTANKKEDFFKRIARSLNFDFTNNNIVDFKKMGFTTRELEFLTNKSRSSISRLGR